MRLEARLRSTGVILELLVVLRLDNIPAHDLGHLLNPIVQGGRSSCTTVKFFSLSLQQYFVVFVLVIKLARSGRSGAPVSTRSLLNRHRWPVRLLLANRGASSRRLRSLGRALCSLRVLVS